MTGVDERMREQELACLGLTREEALLLCKEMNLNCRFALTQDPKTATVSGTEFFPGPATKKVIRARETAGEMVFLLGNFAPEKKCEKPWR